MSNNNIYIIIINRRLYYFQINTDKIFIINKCLRVVKFINIKKFKNISLRNKYSIDIKFFSDNEVEIIPTRFLSNKDKESLIYHILPDSRKNLETIIFRKLFLKLIKKRYIYNQFLIRMRRIADKHNYLYFYDVYDSFENISTFKQILFLAYNSSFVKKVIKILYFDMTIYLSSPSDN